MEAKLLRRAGLKITLPRMKILEIMEQSASRHLSAEDIYRQLLKSHSEIGIATVYRVLTQLAAAGLISRHHFEEGGTAVFELKESAHHDHMVCIGCGRIEEFVDNSIEELQLTAAKRVNYELVDHSLVLYGRCAQCIARMPSQPNA